MALIEGRLPSSYCSLVFEITMEKLVKQKKLAFVVRMAEKTALRTAKLFLLDLASRNAPFPAPLPFCSARWSLVFFLTYAYTWLRVRHR